MKGTLRELGRLDVITPQLSVSHTRIVSLRVPPHHIDFRYHYIGMNLFQQHPIPTYLCTPNAKYIHLATGGKSRSVEVVL
jgi:hypothetical protein